MREKNYQMNNVRENRNIFDLKRVFQIGRHDAFHKGLAYHLKAEEPDMEKEEKEALYDKALQFIMRY